MIANSSNSTRRGASATRKRHGNEEETSNKKRRTSKQEEEDDYEEEDEAAEEEEEDIEFGIGNEHTDAVKYDPFTQPYLPQLGDRVFYLREGHNEYIDKFSKYFLSARKKLTNNNAYPIPFENESLAREISAAFKAATATTTQSTSDGDSEFPTELECRLSDIAYELISFNLKQGKKTSESENSDEDSNRVTLTCCRLTLEPIIADSATNRPSDSLRFVINYVLGSIHVIEETESDDDSDDNDESKDAAEPTRVVLVESDFIVLSDRYLASKSLHSKLKAGRRATVYFDGKPFVGKITHVARAEKQSKARSSVYQRPDPIFSGVDVKWDDGSSSTVNTFELQEITKEVNYKVPTFDKKVADSLAAKIDEFIQSTKQSTDSQLATECAFLSEQQSQFISAAESNRVNLPYYIQLPTVVQRLRNGFYRSREAVFRDLEHINNLLAQYWKKSEGPTKFSAQLSIWKQELASAATTRNGVSGNAQKPSSASTLSLLKTPARHNDNASSSGSATPGQKTAQPDMSVMETPPIKANTISSSASASVAAKSTTDNHSTHRSGALQTQKPAMKMKLAVLKTITVTKTVKLCGKFAAPHIIEIPIPDGNNETVQLGRKNPLLTAYLDIFVSRTAATGSLRKTTTQQREINQQQATMIVTNTDVCTLLLTVTGINPLRVYSKNDAKYTVLNKDQSYELNVGDVLELKYDPASDSGQFPLELVEQSTISEAAGNPTPIEVDVYEHELEPLTASTMISAFGGESERVNETQITASMMSQSLMYANSQLHSTSNTTQQQRFGSLPPPPAATSSPQIGGEYLERLLQLSERETGLSKQLARDACELLWREGFVSGELLLDCKLTDSDLAAMGMAEPQQRTAVLSALRALVAASSLVGKTQ